MTPRTHVYIPDHSNGPDHRGDYPCLTCGLPRVNRAHTLPPAPGEHHEQLARYDPEERR